jgi:hypothetical protein
LRLKRTPASNGLGDRPSDRWSATLAGNLTLLVPSQIWLRPKELELPA